MLYELKLEIGKIIIFEDNQSTIRAVKNYDQKRKKHIDIKFKFIREKIEDKVISVEYINTK